MGVVQAHDPVTQHGLRMSCQYLFNQTSEGLVFACHSALPPSVNKAHTWGAIARLDCESCRAAHLAPALCRCASTSSSRTSPYATRKSSESSDSGTQQHPLPISPSPHLDLMQPGRQLIAACKSPARLNQSQPEVPLAVRVAEGFLAPTLCHCVSTSDERERPLPPLELSESSDSEVPPATHLL